MNDDAGVTLHDPTSEVRPEVRPRRPPPPSLEGRTVALFDIGKPRSAEFLDRIEAGFQAAGVRSVRFAKPTNAKPAEERALGEIAAGADAVVEALAD